VPTDLYQYNLPLKKENLIAVKSVGPQVVFILNRILTSLFEGRQCIIFKIDFYLGDWKQGILLCGMGGIWSFGQWFPIHSARWVFWVHTGILVSRGQTAFPTPIQKEKSSLAMQAYSWPSSLALPSKHPI